jgi:hypothetical protein
MSAKFPGSDRQGDAARTLGNSSVTVVKAATETFEHALATSTTVNYGVNSHFEA